MRKAVKVLNGLLNSLRLEKHPEKTFVGKTERGFDCLDFLGYPIRPDGISVASKGYRFLLLPSFRLSFLGVDT